MSVFLDLEAWRFSVVLLTVASVLSAELFNTAIEVLTHTVHPDQDPQIGRALDVAAGAVLMVSIAAAAIGFIVIGPPLWQWITGS